MEINFTTTEQRVCGINLYKLLITKMSSRMFTYLPPHRPFFLYIAFHDPHRCGDTDVNAKYGQFCEHWGSGEPNMGIIPDWKPYHYNPDSIRVPYFLPDTPETRQDLANMYTAYSRMDQGKL